MPKRMTRLEILRQAQGRAHELVDDCAALSDEQLKDWRSARKSDDQLIASLTLGILQEAEVAAEEE